MSKENEFPALLPEKKEVMIKKEPDLVPTVIDRLNKVRFLSIFGPKLKEFDMQIQSVREMEITSKDQHSEAEMKIRILKDSIVYIKDLTKTILNPYSEMLNECKEASNELVNKIEDVDKELRNKIIAFQKLNASTASVGIQGDYESKKKLINNTIVLNERVNIICKQLYARLRGGLGPKLNGTTGTFNGIHNEQDCDYFIAFVEEKFPDSSQYGEFATMVQYAKDMGIKIAKWQKNIFEKKAVNEDVSGLESDIEKFYNTYNSKTDSDYIKTKETLDKKLDKLDKEYNKEIKSLTKGITYTWSYTVESSVMVPEEFKSVDKDKIKKFITDHKEGLEEKISKLPDGTPVLLEQPIEGITLFKKESKRIT
jgi:hypothetical protein